MMELLERKMGVNYRINWEKELYIGQPPGNTSDACITPAC